MLNFSIISAMVRRYVYNLKHDLNSLTDAFYQPAMEVFIWGITSTYLKTASGNLSHLVILLLSGVVFWIAVNQAQQSISVNLMREFWDRNLVNIFASPIRIREWIAAVIIEGVIRTLLALMFAILLVLILYKTNLFTYGILMIPFMISLFLTGWAIGFFISGLIIRFGHTFQAFAWIGVTLLAPFSAVFYPLSALPEWMQIIGKLLPTSYIFQGMREVLNSGKIPYEQISVSFALNTFYLVLSIWFFVRMFNKSRELGLGRLV